MAWNKSRQKKDRTQQKLNFHFKNTKYCAKLGRQERARAHTLHTHLALKQMKKCGP